MLRGVLDLETDLWDLSTFVLLFLLNLLLRSHGESVRTLPFFIVITPFGLGCLAVPPAY